MHFSNSEFPQEETVKLYALIWPCGGGQTANVKRAAETTTSKNGIFTIHIVFCSSVLSNLHRFNAFERPSKLGKFGCRLTKNDGILQDMLCSWSKTKWFNGILGQIQINTKLGIDHNFDNATHTLHSPRPVFLTIRTVVFSILNTALRNLDSNLDLSLSKNGTFGGLAGYP